MPDDIVYSTGSGDLRKKQKAASPQSSSVKRDGIVRVRRESKGRGGKTVTAVYGLPLAPPQLSELAGRLKQKCGAGGTVKDGVIIIQGDRTDYIIQYLSQEGYTVKRSGA
ncbi:MAG: hypothetical protein JW807_02420 [Spirochaetes bacterium]|nr:hypothetical protein [Spirochaetota bacterium]